MKAPLSDSEQPKTADSTHFLACSISKKACFYGSREKRCVNSTDTALYDWAIFQYAGLLLFPAEPLGKEEIFQSIALFRSHNNSFVYQCLEGCLQWTGRLQTMFSFYCFLNYCFFNNLFFSHVHTRVHNSIIKWAISDMRWVECVVCCVVGIQQNVL